MNHLNIEIKAYCHNQDYVRELLKQNNASFQGTDHQIDTYFIVNNGRLKLREGNIENHLIYYDRENIEGPKQSNIILFDSDPKSSLKSILLKSLGELVVVDKMREIYWIDNVKFHLDKIEGLGTFVEIEAIATDGDMTKDVLLEQCNSYLKILNIKDSDLLSVSYSDLLLEKSSSYKK